MRSYHWGMIVAFLILGYIIGMVWPMPGQWTRAKLGV